MPSDLHLHIISFDVPYPVDYGGVIDVFYKIKSLQEAGVKIHLHCFEYGRPRQKELEKYCLSVNYYPRQTTKSSLFNTLPYIVLTRKSEELKKNLLKNKYPILMEGLHSTFLINDPDFSGRKIIVRTHNVEHHYYEGLAKSERNIFKRYYFYNESGKLGKYESVLHDAAAIAAISPDDTKHFSAINKNSVYIPAFHPFEDVKVKEGRGEYLFYHGNLSVGENDEAALFLVNKVFNDLPYKLVIAGAKPSDELKKAVKLNPRTQLLSDLSPSQIYDFVRNAQGNILPTFQATGIKLKLLASLFVGRFCIVNTPMVVNTGLEPLCLCGNTPAELKALVKQVMEAEAIPLSEIEKRKKVLMKNFSNIENAKKLIHLI